MCSQGVSLKNYLYNHKCVFFREGFDLWITQCFILLHYFAVPSRHFSSGLCSLDCVCVCEGVGRVLWTQKYSSIQREPLYGCVCVCLCAGNW